MEIYIKLKTAPSYFTFNWANLYEGHVNLINIRSLLPVHLDANKMFIKDSNVTLG